jgi:uncharacterized protein (TIGR03790 family)
MFKPTLVCLGMLVSSITLQAELLPEQIAIIAREKDDESAAVAAYYAKQRAVPTNQILSLPFPDSEVMARAEWDSIRPRIRKWLSDNKLTRRVKCFVTVWGVPLKIEAGTDDPEAKRTVAFLTAERNARVKQLNRIFQQFNSLATDKPAPLEPIKADATLEDLKQRFQDVFLATQQRVQAITDEPKKQASAAELQNLFLASVGVRAFGESLGKQLQSATTANATIQSQFDITRGRLIGIQESRAVLESLEHSIDRDLEVASLIEKTDGITSVILWLTAQIEAHQKNESYASLDSELSLVAWSDYGINHWQPNYLNVRFRDSAITALRPTYMVARVDAPTLLLAKQMIDTAVQVEKEGSLKGKAYFDGRGLAKAEDQVQPGTHPDFDKSVVQTANIVKQYGTLEVVLNENAELFQPGACPNAAIYCGWYSLANYVDAFDWSKGAVAYHIASGEADTLHKPDSNVWCKKMLEDGVCATMGPVQEHPIIAFPRPEQFFLLLLSGKYTLAECYWMSVPFNSWTMTLIGDPLYNPFKKSSGLKVDTLPNAVRAFLDG